MSDQHEELTVIINGVRYVPARSLIAGVEDFRNALLDIFWGEGYRGVNPEVAEKGIYIAVYDQPMDGGEPFSKFIDDLIAKLAK